MKICREIPRTEVRGTDCKTKPFGLGELRVDDDLVVGKRCFVLLEVGFEQAGVIKAVSAVVAGRLRTAGT